MRASGCGWTVLAGWLLHSFLGGLPWVVVQGSRTAAVALNWRCIYAIHHHALPAESPPGPAGSSPLRRPGHAAHRRHARSPEQRHSTHSNNPLFERQGMYRLARARCLSQRFVYRTRGIATTCRYMYIRPLPPRTPDTSPPRHISPRRMNQWIHTNWSQ